MELIASPANQLAVLQFDINELQTQIELLKRSNTELLLVQNLLQLTYLNSLRK